MQPLFSIIIPVYNVEQYLRDCLDSVFQQTYTNFEIICVNDGSTDNSLAILEAYKLKHPELIIVNQKNGGLSNARNTGLKKASGDYIFFLDSDDWIAKETLEVLANTIQNNEDIICFNGKMFFEDSGKEKVDKGIEEKQMTGWEYYNKYALVPRNFHFVCVVLRLYKRTFLLENNIFFEEGIYHEDNLFTPIVCYYAQKVRVIPDALYVYRRREGSIMSQMTKKRLADIIYVANALSDFFIPKKDVDKSILYREIAGQYSLIFVTGRTYKTMLNSYETLKNNIDWHKYKEVAHKSTKKQYMYYFLLRGSPLLFYIFVRILNMIKK